MYNVTESNIQEINIINLYSVNGGIYTPGDPFTVISELLGVESKALATLHRNG
jgi:hypothetical protein